MNDDTIITWACVAVLVWCLSAWGTLTFLIWREDRRWRKWWTTGLSK